MLQPPAKFEVLIFRVTLSFDLLTIEPGVYVLSLEWKREEVMDGVTVVTDDERG